MDTRALQEQLHEVQAQLRQAISAVTTAESALAQRKSEKLQPRLLFVNVKRS